MDTPVDRQTHPVSTIVKLAEKRQLEIKLSAICIQYIAEGAVSSKRKCTAILTAVDIRWSNYLDIL